MRLVLGAVLETAGATEDFAFAKRVGKCNGRIRAVAAEMCRPPSSFEVADTAVEFAAAERTWDDTRPDPNGEIRVAAAFACVLAHRYAPATLRVRTSQAPSGRIRVGAGRIPAVGDTSGTGGHGCCGHDHNAPSVNGC